MLDQIVSLQYSDLFLQSNQVGTCCCHNNRLFIFLILLKLLIRFTLSFISILCYSSLVGNLIISGSIGTFISR